MVVQAIYISLFMGVTKKLAIPRPNPYKQCAESSRQFVTRFLNGPSQEIKVKLNESRLLKFYQVKQRKHISTENSAEKNLKEDSKLNEFWNISTKQKRKKILKFKEPYFPDTLFDKFQQITLKFATLYLFYPFLSRFFCIKFLFKNFIVCVIFSNLNPN